MYYFKTNIKNINKGERNMKGYKAFEKGMICRGKQYAENTVFEEDAAEICKRGMHFCKFPLKNGEFVEVDD